MRWPLMLRKTHDRLMSEYLDGYSKEYADIGDRYTKICAQLARERNEISKKLSREQEIGLGAGPGT